MKDTILKDGDVCSIHTSAAYSPCINLIGLEAPTFNRWKCRFESVMQDQL